MIQDVVCCDERTEDLREVHHDSLEGVSVVAVQDALLCLICQLWFPLHKVPKDLDVNRQR